MAGHQRCGFSRDLAREFRAEREEHAWETSLMHRRLQEARKHTCSMNCAVWPGYSSACRAYSMQCRSNGFTHHILEAVGTHSYAAVSAVLMP